VTTQGNKFNLVIPTLIQTGYGEDKHRNGGAGQPPRTLDLAAPLGTVVAGGTKHALVAAFMAQNNTGEVGHQVERPVSTIVGKGCTQSLVTAHLQRDFGKSVGSGASEPVPTITSGGGGHAALVASSLVKFKGTARDGQQLSLPLHTVQAGGMHYAEVRAFLVAYFGNEKEGGPLNRPMRTVTSRDRFGLVTVHGEQYAIADIGMRMLAPRELYRAQGFPDSYRIDIEFKGKPLTKTAQVRMCGNSVCPPLASAIVRANLGSADVGEVAA
jgi:DNA (cytosine-5)-methyltransferase 1